MPLKVRNEIPVVIDNFWYTVVEYDVILNPVWKEES